MSKNLVYYSVGIRDEYGEMIKISIDSLDRSNQEILDVLIITDQKFFNRNFSNYHREKTIFYLVEDIESPDQICFNKVRVFEFDGVKEYSNIIYFDSDVLINYQIEDLFSRCLSDNKLYAPVEDYSIENHRRIQFGFEEYKQEDIDFFREKKIYTFNCGTFMFKNSYLMRNHFRTVYSMMVENKKKFFADQSFMNYYFNTHNLTDTRSIQKEADYVYVVEENINFITDFKNKIFHFLGNTYNGVSKIDKIKEFYKRIKND